jgi:hypothetical protein
MGMPKIKCGNTLIQEISMRPIYSNIHHHEVCQLANKIMSDCLDLKKYKLSVSPKDLISLLLLMAVSCRSLFSASRRVSSSHETARKALNANLRKDINVLNKMVDLLESIEDAIKATYASPEPKLQ